MARSIASTDGTNKFCEIKDLANEATVEQFFVNRLLGDLGYRDSQICPKTSLSAHTVNLGRKKLQYKPDYAMQVRRKVRWICDAKAVDEDLDEWVGQCASYCLLLNREYSRDDPVEYFFLTNGIESRVYAWNQADPILTLRFSDFADRNARYEQLQALLGQKRFGSPSATKDLSKRDTLTLERRSISEINSDFAYCHRHIWTKENLSYSAAFMEFVKVVFLKLLSDQLVHDRYGPISADGTLTVPLAEVKF